jgi:CPA1 family monovalent cation:H+ antiporter
MVIPHIVLFFLVLVGLAVLVEPLAARLGLPASAALVLVGFTASEAVVALGVDTGLRWWHFHDLIFYVFLPVLIFEAAFHLDLRLLSRNLIAVLILAIPAMLLSTGLIAVIVYYGIGHPSGFPWIAALITGALLSATDPAAVLDLLKRLGAPQRLRMLVDGESLFNDATAIVLFSLLLGLAAADRAQLSWTATLVEFLRVFLGGALVGGAIGALGWPLVTRLQGALRAALITIIAAYGSFLLAEDALHVSGVMAVLAAGLVLGAGYRRRQRAEFVGELWRFKGHLANAMLFLLSGMTITVIMFTDRWLAMLIGIAAVAIARALAVFSLCPLISRLPGQATIPWSYQAVLYWGGVRGAVTLALALSLPAELEYGFTIQSIAYGVVVFNLFIQAPTMAPLMRRLPL